MSLQSKMENILKDLCKNLDIDEALSQLTEAILQELPKKKEYYYKVGQLIESSDGVKIVKKIANAGFNQAIDLITKKAKE